MSKGEYVVIMDDDDLMLPHRLREQVNCLTPGSAGRMEGGLIRIQIWSLNIILAVLRLQRNLVWRQGHASPRTYKKLMMYCLSLPYDENYSFGTDYVMNLEIARAGHRLNHTGSYILLRRFHGGNVTITNAGEQKNTARVRVKEFLQELDEATEKKMRAEWAFKATFQRYTSANFN